MQAALGRSQLKRVDRSLPSVKANFTRLKAGLFEGTTGLVILDAQSPDTKVAATAYRLSCPMNYATSATTLRLALNAAGVGTSIYYPSLYRNLNTTRTSTGDTAGQYPNAERISYQSIALPVGQHLNTEDMDYIADQFKRVLKEFI
jgi:dTDP-4-amino-4,6-dideoxygalactose transaminase